MDYDVRIMEYLQDIFEGNSLHLGINHTIDFRRLEECLKDLVGRGEPNPLFTKAKLLEYLGVAYFGLVRLYDLFNPETLLALTLACIFQYCYIDTTDEKQEDDTRASLLTWACMESNITDLRAINLAFHIMKDADLQYPESEEGKILRDLSLLYLESGIRTCVAHEECIRTLYSQFSDEDYWTARLSFFHELLDSPIYLSNHFSNRLNIRPREKVREIITWISEEKL